jgi:hypothetical protein
VEGGTTVTDPTLEVDEDDIAADFRRVMASVTEQACASGREIEIMEALFPVLLNGVGDHDGEDPDS